MVKKEDHLKAAAKNAEFLEYIEKQIPPFEEWGIIVLFYQVVHYIEAYLAEKQEHSQSHAERHYWLKKFKIPDKVRDNYMNIYNLSRAARYQYPCFHKEEFDSLKKESQEIINHFKKTIGKQSSKNNKAE